MRKFREYFRHAVQKLTTILQQTSSFFAAKNRVLAPRYFIAVRFGLRSYTRERRTAHKEIDQSYTANSLNCSYPSVCVDKQHFLF